MIGYDNKSINHQILIDLPFLEASGIITRDQAKPHHEDIDLINTPTWATLSSGLGVLELNGTNQYLELAIADSADLDFTSGDYSIGGWFYFATGGADDKTLMGRFLVDNNGWELYHYTNEIITLRHHHSGGATTRTACYSENWPFDQWWFMGVSRSGISATFYRNGVSLTTSCSSGGLINPEACNQKFFVGNDSTGINLHKGKQWRPRIWDRSLSASEWSQLFECERHWFGI
jgi:hypothetical protein